MNELARLAEAAYRRLVWDEPEFEAWFRRATPIDEIGRMELGSRPPRRPGGASPTLTGLRAIPWVFAWSQSRTNLPAWFGVGAALSAYANRHAQGRRRLVEAYEGWDFFRSLIDNVELGLAIADPVLAARFAELAGDAPSMRHIGAELESERDRTLKEIAMLTGATRLLERSPRLRRSIELRTPYVDVLSELQVHALERLRSDALSGDDRQATEELLRLTVAGVAAGLQHTG